MRDFGCNKRHLCKTKALCCFLHRSLLITHSSFIVMAHVDVISDILAAAVRRYPDSAFVQGLSHQYLVKGGLSKRQLEGLYKRAEGIKDLPPGKLATLQAIILKRHQKYKSSLPEAPLPVENEDTAAPMIDAILNKYPQHKRVLFFQAKLKAHEPLSAAETTELLKFHKLLVH